MIPKDSAVTEKEIGFASVIDRNDHLTSRSSSEALNNALLSGQEPDEYRATNRLTRNAPKSLSPQAIVQENILNFDKVLEDKLLPYKKIVEVMQDATLTRRTTKKVIEHITNPSGKQVPREKYVTAYETVPDFDMQLKAVRLYAYLTGLDPKVAQSIQIRTAGGTEINIGALYNESVMNINVMTPEQQLDAYNQMQQTIRGGTLILPANYPDSGDVTSGNGDNE